MNSSVPNSALKILEKISTNLKILAQNN